MAQEHEYFILVDGQIEVVYDSNAIVLFVQIGNDEPAIVLVVTKLRNLKLAV